MPRLKILLKSAALILAGFLAGTLLAPQSVQAAINYFDTTKTVSGTGSVSCGYGWKVTGGGAYPLPSDYYGTSSSDEYKLTGSYPLSSGSWTATAKRTHGTYSSYNGWSFSNWPYSPRVYAICTR